MAQTQVKKKNKPTLLRAGLAELIDEEYIESRKNRYFTSSYFLNDSWKEKKRNWGHSLHGMASRSGSFPPALTDYFIQNFSNQGDTILDPFSGKGTTALQACLNQRHGIGLDVAPEAYALTAAKTLSINHDDAVAYLQKLEFIQPSKADLAAVPKEVKVFYHDNVLKQILGFREAINQDYSFRHLSYIDAPKFEQAKKSKNASYAQYWVGVIIGIIHGSSELSLSVPCSHSYSMAPNYVAKYSKEHGLEKPDRDLKECLIKRSEKLLSSGVNAHPGRAILGSAMDLPTSLHDSIDLIVTSPPYFTAQTYAWDNWLREWFLGFNFKEVHKQTLHTAVEDKYRVAMRQHLEEAFKVLKSGRWAFYVVGDVIKKTKAGPYKIITAEIIAQEAEETGFSVELIINDDIPRTSCYNSAFLKEDQGLKLDRVVCLYKK